MTAQEDYQAFLDAQTEDSYDLESMTEEEQTTEMITYTKLKLAAGKEKVKVAEFSKLKEAAFNDLAIKQDQERIALGKVWQAYEDNDYTVD